MRTLSSGVVVLSILFGLSLSGCVAIGTNKPIFPRSLYAANAAGREVYISLKGGTEKRLFVEFQGSEIRAFQFAFSKRGEGAFQDYFGAFGGVVPIGNGNYVFQAECTTGLDYRSKEFVRLAYTLYAPVAPLSKSGLYWAMWDVTNMDKTILQKYGAKDSGVRRLGVVFLPDNISLDAAKRFFNDVLNAGLARKEGPTGLLSNIDSETLIYRKDDSLTTEFASELLSAALEASGMRARTLSECLALKVGDPDWAVLPP
jgi:hypothetical protein